MSTTASAVHNISSSDSAYPPLPQRTGMGGVDHGRGENWVKIQSRSPTMDYSLFLNQPINPFIDSKGRTDTQPMRTTIYVQDSGVVMTSTTHFPRQSGTATKRASSNGSSGNAPSQKDQALSRPAGSNASKPAQTGGQGEIEDDWEVVYPDD